ncbi:brachyurin-like [Anthonomus grandis grandis]|uniref:brachyurin-like n=1 Tax=Anthonomus grandis grandis TaxID=2921223 RepID=UPI002165F3CA|nr:brachyurin-like [Anthonomus grandis grandis]
MANLFCCITVIFLAIGSFHFPEVQAKLKITNGEEVTPHSMPYVVALQAIIQGKAIQCGGSLVKTNKILTAASCVYEATNVTVTLGAHNLDENEETQVKIEVTNVTIHENYDPDKHYNDLAVINLDSPVELNAAMSTIPTPTLSDIIETYADELGIVAGWGKLDTTNATYSPVLRKMDATIIPFLACTISYLGQVHMNQICTTGMQDGRNICTGDAGSPLIVNGTQVGVVSYGSVLGCNVGFPGVHTRLTSFYFWLENHLQ